MRRDRRKNKVKYILKENTARWSAITETVQFREGEKLNSVEHGDTY